MIKHLLCTSPTFWTIEEEEDGSDEDSVEVSVGECPVSAPCRLGDPVEEDSNRLSSPPWMRSKLLNMSNLHEVSRHQLLECLRQTRAEKKSRRKVLREFEDEFYRQTGRICQKEDRSPMKDEYQEYKQLKAKLRLLEVLLSKQEVPKTM